MTQLAFMTILAVAALLFAGCAGTTTTNPSDAASNATSTTTQAATDPCGDIPAGTSPFPIPAKSTPVAGSGATFPKPLLESWGITYACRQPHVQVSYAGGGSGKGISDITAKNVVFGASDAPLAQSDKDKAPGIQQFPETLGLIAVVYNVANVANGLHLDGETVGKIYTGSIRFWDDEAIKALNPGMTLPHNGIATVHRSDSSGTTFVFTDWMGKTSPSWAGLMGPAPAKSPAWANTAASQLSGNGNDGVGSLVKSTPNSIGYVELAFVRSLNLNAGQIKSHDGAFLAPTTAGAAAAAAGFADKLPTPTGDWSKVSIVDAPGATSYPVSTFTYTLVYDTLAAYNHNVSEDQMNGFKSWMWWCLHEGQADSESLGYAPLPASVVAIGETALKAIH